MSLISTFTLALRPELMQSCGYSAHEATSGKFIPDKGLYYTFYKLSSFIQQMWDTCPVLCYDRLRFSIDLPLEELCITPLVTWELARTMKICLCLASMLVHVLGRCSSRLFVWRIAWNGGPKWLDPVSNSRGEYLSRESVCRLVLY